MKIKSKIFAFLIILCILLCISAVSASETQHDNYQANIELNQELESQSISEISDTINDDEKLKSTNREELSSVNAGTFNDFHSDVMNSTGTLNLERDYIHSKNDDAESACQYIENLTINGNGHIIDGNNGYNGITFYLTEGSVLTRGNLVINDLTFKNFIGITLSFSNPLNATLNNVTLINCSNNVMGLIGVSENSQLHFNNSKIFYPANCENILFGDESKIILSNSNFTGAGGYGSAIFLNRGQLIIENCTFENFSSNHGAIINFKGDHFTLKNSKFLNSHVNLTGGAIIAKYFPIAINNNDTKVFVPSDAMLIENCLFSNLSSVTNGGVIYLDLDSGSEHIPQSLNIVSSNFTNCKSKIGGAIAIIGGALNIADSRFINNSAQSKAGAVFSSWTNVNISNSIFENNTAKVNAGALFFDKGKLTITESSFITNKALKESDTTSNAVYAYDAVAYLANSVFDNGGIGVYADFSDNSKIENVTKNDDTFIMNPHNYIVSVESKGIELNLTKNEVVYDSIPSKFDLRDWDWVTPGKLQSSDNDDCWAFATAASLESALLKATNVTYNLSQNYIQKLQLKYSEVGDKRISLTGFGHSGLGYALSWYGPLPIDGPYDDRGMIESEDFDVPRIHLQDALIIQGERNDTEKLIKEAVMKYGGVTVHIFINPKHEKINDTGDDISIMDHSIHFVSIIGWDDDYEESGVRTPSWITKDSLIGFNTLSYDYLDFLAPDYYAIVPQNSAIAYIFENDIEYHVNYQTDLTGLTGFDGNYTYYSNEFASKYDEYIGAVGTYFNDSGINYSFDILVNNETLYTQTGVSEFAGFRTIILNKYIPIKTGDKFKVVFQSNSVPYQAWSRVHYMNGTSLASIDGEDWTDFAPLNKTVCLKVYTVQINNNSFAALGNAISQSGDELNLTQDYIFDKSSDINILVDDEGNLKILIEKNKLIINGNNHVIDGAGLGANFNFLKPIGEFVVNDVTFKNFNTTIISCAMNITLNNVNFTGCIIPEYGIIEAYQANFNVTNCNFYSNQVLSIFDIDNSKVIIRNSNFYGDNNYGQAIRFNRGQLSIYDSSFENFTFKNGAFIDYKGDFFELVNSSFINAKSSLSGGAIIAKYFPYSDFDLWGHRYVPTSPILIKNCIFTNLSCENDGGAIHIDLDSASYHVPKTMNIINSNFTDCGAKFGGAISIMGGNLNIAQSNFINNLASFEGGAIYSSWTNISINKSNFANNRANKNAGALYFDKGKLTINQSNITGNMLLEPFSISANAVYAHDVAAFLSNSIFDNGGIAVYADFADNSKIENVEKNDDIFLMDNHDYIVSVESKGIKLNLTNDEINIDTIPSQFDAREKGWTTPGKVQGDNYDCWAFATTAALETALLKSTGVAYNLSENYVQKLQLKYFKTGDLRNSLTGFIYSGLGYSLSWFGALPTDSLYDDRGMISDTDLGVERIHLQDAMFIYTGQDDTIELLKRAIMKYGAVAVQYYVHETGEKILSEGDDIAIMDHDTHFISLIGWKDLDDEFGGVWLTKDSLKGFDQTAYMDFPNIDYYAIVPQRVAVAYIFENDIDYHVNYQTDLTGLVGFDGNYTTYSNEFTSKYDELIGAVGTYFNESGINYSFDIFINGQKVHTQTGVSEFPGFRTIVLDKYLPVKTSDQFKVVFKSNSVPYQAWSRVHYMNGTSLASIDGNDWTDFAPLNKTVCLKVYTVAYDTKIINNKDITVDYGGGSYFSVKVVAADGRGVLEGENVTFKINSKNVTVKTDSNGVARIPISELPGKYTITTTYQGIDYKNTVTVRQVLKLSKVSVKNTDKKLVLKASLIINGKAVAGKIIKFTFYGKTYSAKTNSKGIASVTIKKSVINKLTKKSYTVKATYLKNTVKSSVNVKQVLKASKASVKKSAKSFKLKASLKINGKAAKNKLIKFKFKGKTYKAKTDKKGIAKLTIKKSVIKKLKKGKKYSVTVSYLKDYVKTTVSVK